MWHASRTSSPIFLDLEAQRGSTLAFSALPQRRFEAVRRMIAGMLRRWGPGVPAQSTHLSRIRDFHALARVSPEKEAIAKSKRFDPDQTSRQRGNQAKPKPHPGHALGWAASMVTDMVA